MGQITNSRFFVRSVPLFCSLMLTPMGCVKEDGGNGSEREEEKKAIENDQIKIKYFYLRNGECVYCINA